MSSGFRGSADGTPVTINPGEYSVNEGVLSRYKEIATAGCHGTAVAG
jgi:hypothetical protein